MVSLLAPAPHIISLKMWKSRRREQRLSDLDQKIVDAQEVIEQATVALKRNKTERDAFVWQTCSMSRDEEYDRKLDGFDQISATLCAKLSELRLNLVRYEERRSRIAER